MENEQQGLPFPAAACRLSVQATAVHLEAEHAGECCEYSIPNSSLGTQVHLGWMVSHFHFYLFALQFGQGQLCYFVCGESSSVSVPAAPLSLTSLQLYRNLAVSDRASTGMRWVTPKDYGYWLPCPMGCDS